jgi:hypothetical protein
MTIDAYIACQPAGRQALLQALHQVIIDNDTTVTPGVGPMMGKEMILYNAPGIFKYGLAGVKNYMSLHVMPIYGSATLYDKYKQLLPKANFQKGCINFKNVDEMQPEVVAELIKECAKIDLMKFKQEHR